jgi:putative exosortase-associated protein (TIGR04073 family)
MDKQRFAISVLVVFLALGLLVPPAAAAEEGAGQKFTRGALNTTTGWTDLPKEVVTQSAEDPYRGMTYGFLDGLASGTKRTLYGTWDFVTFPIPPYNKPVMEPETPFGDAP